MATSKSQIGFSKASDWRKWKQEGYRLEFPSGNVAYVRPVSLDMLLEESYVPNELVVEVEKMLGSARTFQRNADNANLVEVTRGAHEYAHAVAYASFVSPRIVENPEGDDEISPDDLDPEDLAFLQKWVGVPASKLRKFSQEQEAGLDPVPPFQRDDDESEPTGEDRPLAEGEVGEV